jgi:hypothetical protein
VTVCDCDYNTQGITEVALELVQSWPYFLGKYFQHPADLVQYLVLSDYYFLFSFQMLSRRRVAAADVLQ